MGLMTGKQSRQGPTPEMLRTYYKLLFLMSGDLNNAYFGAVTNRGQDDIGILHGLPDLRRGLAHPRGLWVMGDGFVESKTVSAPRTMRSWRTTWAVSLRDPSYYALSGSVVASRT